MSFCASAIVAAMMAVKMPMTVTKCIAVSELMKIV